MRYVAIYVRGTPEKPPPMHDRMQICFLLRIKQINFIHILKLYTASMLYSWENAILHRA